MISPATYLFSSGIEIENLALEFCKSKNYPVKINHEFQRLGIDFFYCDKIIKAVDAKNTLYLYIANVFKKNSNPKINIRHPFKIGNAVDELWIYDKFKKDWYFRGNKEEYLQKFFFNSNNMNLFFNYIQSLENISLEPGKECLKLLSIKEKLKSYLKRTYVTVVESADQYTLKMIHYDDLTYLQKHGDCIHI